MSEKHTSASGCFLETGARCSKHRGETRAERTEELLVTKVTKLYPFSTILNTETCSVRCMHTFYPRCLTIFSSLQSCAFTRREVFVFVISELTSNQFSWSIRGAKITKTIMVNWWLEIVIFLNCVFVEETLVLCLLAISIPPTCVTPVSLTLLLLASMAGTQLTYWLFNVAGFQAPCPYAEKSGNL